VFAARNQLSCLAPQEILKCSLHVINFRVLLLRGNWMQWRRSICLMPSCSSMVQMRPSSRPSLTRWARTCTHTHTHTCCRYAEYIHTHSAESTKDITHTHTHIHTHAPSPCIGTLCESEKCYCKLLYYALLSPVRACVQCHTHYCNALTPLSCCSIHGMIHSTLVTHTKVKNY
jgi:hypothetical protein